MLATHSTRIEIKMLLGFQARYFMKNLYLEGKDRIEVLLEE